MKQAPPEVSIIVVSYNTREMTLDCLRSVAAETKLAHEVVVVDNASADGSVEAIAAEFPSIQLMAEFDNHGFAEANNLAVRHARGRYLLLLNPDTVILDRAIDRLVEFATACPQARVWGGRTVFADGSLNPASCWRRQGLWNITCRTLGLTAIFPRSALFNAEAYGGWDRMDERQVDIVSGCFFLIERADWEDLGGFDPTFFMYGEEADLCLRATRDLGAAPRVTPEAAIVHYGGASEKVRADKMVRLLCAKMELIKRHVPTRQRVLATAMFRLWPLTRLVATTLLWRDSRHIWAEIWRRRREWRAGFSG